MMEKFPLPKSSFSRDSIQKYYDRISRFYDLSGIFESRAKTLARCRLDLTPGLRLLNIGLGTGLEQREFVERTSPGGVVAGIDLSFKMLKIAAGVPGGHLCQGDASRLPFQRDGFDRIYCAYVLDLVLPDEISGWMAEFRRVLQPGGKLVLLSLTGGIDRSSRLLVNLWMKFYEINPVLFGGCRPLDLWTTVTGAGFDCLERSIIVQLGLPSEVIVAV